MSHLDAHRRRLLALGACWPPSAALAGLASAAPARAAPAVPSGPALTLGHSSPVSGIFASSAAEARAAIDAALAQTHAEGGIHGRPLQVLTLDDGYDAERALANAERLRTQEGALALIAPVGTATLDALMPWAERTRTPIIGPRSGADRQREYRRYVFFTSASFGDEVRHLVRHWSTLGIGRAALAHFDNPAGRDIRDHFQAAAQASGLGVAGVLAFAPAGTDSAAVAQRLTQPALAAVPLVLAGGGEGTVALLRQLLQHGRAAASIYAMSLLPWSQVQEALGAVAQGMVFTQVVPSPGQPRLPLAAQFRQAMRATPTLATATAFERYLGMRLVVHGLRAAGPGADGAALAEALERAGTIDLAGHRLSFDRHSHHGTRFVDLGILGRGRLLQ